MTGQITRIKDIEGERITDVMKTDLFNNPPRSKLLQTQDEQFFSGL